MKGCAFHWSQAVWRRVQQESLADVYRRRGGVFKFIRMLMALQFLPAPTIPRAFETQKLRATTDATRDRTSVQTMTLRVNKNKIIYDHFPFIIIIIYI
ncbi:hypothetical protein DPMN_100683 [Dreissena polymorpha]|uniref:Uncharacterized protein n=1 Tax=Dreissena polymorpha TaxID=45954 RepID=A0A9D4LHR6_DREPO|nr:hypothetical protein DPMN_100590 [Dreissena polymorpha]KAH3858064.1 hypothetical protein DPMN_100683 [Dreissena polymorpha]